jgi:hypothetical protein
MLLFPQNCNASCKDGHIAETAIIDYRLKFADQGKQTSFLCFRLQQTNRNCRFPLIPFSVYIYIYICICMCTYKWM